MNDVSDWSDVNLESDKESARGRPRLFPATYSKVRKTKKGDTAVLDDLFGFKSSRDKAQANKAYVTNV